MDQEKPNAIASINQYYDSPEAVDALSAWYVRGKEEAFVKFILSRMPLAPEGRFVEIGGGAGLQGLLLRDQLGARYLHSDYSPSLVAKAEQFGLETLIVDGLATPFESNSVGGLLLVGPSTIVGPPDLREKQFRECHRVLASGGGVAFVTSRLAHTRDRHCLNAADEQTLRDIGLTIVGTYYWGVVPGRIWKLAPVGAFWRMLESLGVSVGLGVRKIVIAKKI
jgi:SAM-dependent methyltransferase